MEQFPSMTFSQRNSCARECRRVLFLLLFCMLTTVLPMLLRAQAAGGLSGQVLDPSGALVPGASLTLSRGAYVLRTQSNDAGHYEFKNVPAGRYQLAVDANGFARFSLMEVVINNQARQLNVTLALATQHQQITVTGEATQVGVGADQNASAMVLKGKDIDALSDDPDELQTELSALAGPAAGPNGSDMYVDGFSGGQLPPKSTIREIRVNQNPFSAEFDRIGYGRIEILTKPGVSWWFLRESSF
jgi:hypothetical protein